jgi:DNA-binding NtrC family response regulator
VEIYEGDVMSVATVLIIDDDRELRDFLYCTLKDKYAVATIGAAEEAFSYLAEHSVNVALMDINMSKVDGISALAEIKKSHPHIAVIMMTGDAAPDIKEKVFNMGAFAFLEKPLNMGDLFETIDAAIRK